MQGEVRVLARDGQEVFVGGLFTSIDHVVVTNIARWDGNRWTPLGPGLNGEVRTIAISAQGIYVGGRFVQAGDRTVHRVVRWDGDGWHSLGSGVQEGTVDVLAVAPDGTLFMGGSFDFIGDVGVTNLARWDGVSWRQVGGGFDLFAGRTFHEADVQPARHLARWDGERWSMLEQGVDQSSSSSPWVGALAVDDFHLYVGGHFKRAGDWPASDVCIWHFPPRLEIEKAPDGMRLSWPVGAGDYRLQFGNDMTETAWRQLTNAPIRSDDWLRLTMPSSARRGFYRLRLETIPGELASP